MTAAQQSRSASACFHCASAIAEPGRWRAAIGSIDRDFCCGGCLAIAETIGHMGLASFYASRTTGGSKLELGDAECRRIAEAARASGQVHRRPDGNNEATLLLEGLQCGACVWLIERVLAQQPGVAAANVNYATRRAVVAWNPAHGTLAGLLGAVSSVGYRAHPYDAARREELARREQRSALGRMAVALLAMMQVMMFALPAYTSDEGVLLEHRMLLDWASLVLTLPALLYSALPFFRGAARDLSIGRLGMDVPVALSLLTAFIASVFATHAGTGAVYYDSVTMFVALLSLARYLEVVARNRAGLAIDELACATPAVGERMTHWPKSDDTQTVGAADLARGDIVLVRPGALVPADGVIVQGRSSIEEALLTGESRPRMRAPGDRILAGSVNRDGALVVEVSASGDATQLATIHRMTERAAASRPRLVHAVDRIASWFVVALLLLVALTVAVWSHVDPERVVAIAFALLAVSCPCALSLATPAAIAAATGTLSRRQVVLARPDALETLARVTHVVLDKTGTLTEGRYRVIDIATSHGLSCDRALAIAAALEARSEHPIAQAIRARCEWAVVARDVAIVPGQGIEGTVDGVRWRIGRRVFVGALATGGLAANADATGTGSETEVALGDADGIAATILCTDALRADAVSTVARLRACGLTPIILSGDRASAVDAVATVLGVTDARGDLSPDDKREAIDALQRHGAVVAMVGDGVNDAPALGQAHVSLSLASATPLAQLRSDVVVLRDTLAPIAEAFEHSRRTRTVIRENLTWAVLYNSVAIPAAALGWVTPLVAALGMSISSLVVVGNAMRLVRPEKRRPACAGSRHGSKPMPRSGAA